MELGRSRTKREVTERRSRLGLPPGVDAECREVGEELLVNRANESLLPVLAWKHEVVDLRPSAHELLPAMGLPVPKGLLEHGVTGMWRVS